MNILRELKCMSVLKLRSRHFKKFKRREQAMIKKDRLIKSFLEYVTIDSETGSEEAFADYLINELEQTGLQPVKDSIGNVIVEVKGSPDIEPLLLSAHMDTVNPGKGIKPVVEGGIIRSSGDTILGADDKAGVAIIIETIKTLKEQDISHGDLEVLFTAGEEGGLVGSKNLDYGRIKSRKALVLDCSGKLGEIIINAPSQDSLNVKIIGKSAHAGNKPEDGISAIQVAAKAIEQMSLLRIDEETTANIGAIHGGKVTNIICPEVNIKAEARSLNNQKLEGQTKHMLECFEKAAQEFGAQVESVVKREYSTYKIDEYDDFVRFVMKTGQSLGLDMKTCASGGGSDANNFSAMGVKAINFAVGMNKVHTLEEYAVIEDMEKCAELILEIVRKIKLT
jgi:tripeptide aminopeptidase